MFYLGVFKSVRMQSSTIREHYEQKQQKIIFTYTYVLFFHLVAASLSIYLYEHMCTGFLDDAISKYVYI